MKTAFKLKYVLTLSLGLSACATFGHDAPVHIAITINAAASALSDSPAYADFLNSVSSDLPMLYATNYMVIGSWREDDFYKDEGGLRSYNHFYDPLDPTYDKGLSDYPPDSRKLIGKNSFVWASTYDCPGLDFYLPLANVNTLNIRSWQNARDREWAGLTATSGAERQAVK